MDPELAKAAIKGNLDILRKHLADYQANGDDSILCQRYNKRKEVGNILHLAAWNLQVEFFKEAIKDVSKHQLVKKLLCHQELSGECPGYNPLHVAAAVGGLEMVQAVKQHYSSKFQDEAYKNLPEDSKPWLAKDSTGSTPLHIALQDSQDCALEILSLDLESLCDSVDNSGNSPLFLAFRKRYDEVAKEILSKAPRYIATGEGFYTALHFAPNCSVKVSRLLIKKEVLRIKKEVESKKDATHKYKTPILHKWIELKKAPVLFKIDDEESKDFISDGEIKEYMVDLITTCDHNNSNAFHLFATDQNMNDSKMLADFYNAYKGEDEIKKLPPWLKQNKSLETPLHLALKQDHKDAHKWLKDTYNDAPFKQTQVGPLVRAVKQRKFDVANLIRDTLLQYGWCPFYPNGQKIWQVEGDNRAHVEVAKWLAVNLPNLIPATEAVEALKHASEKGYDWLVESVLKEYPSALENDKDLTWKTACEKGYYKTIVAFIENCPYFRELCLDNQTTPLHHVKFRGYEEYRKLVENPVMQGLTNFQDGEGVSPLHHAIKTDNFELTEVLLNMDGVSRTLKNKAKHTPMELLHNVFTKSKDKRQHSDTRPGEDHERIVHRAKWHKMCERNGITPGLDIKYFRDKPNVYEVRNTLSVVAALLATITFTAGFTVPGGFDQVNGDALLGDKAAFIVFILSDAFAMFCSLVMLVFLMWSMICDSAKSLMLIDNSVPILLVALVSTIVAFMTGVYVVLRKKCLWLAIVIIVLCSLFVLAIYKPLVDRVLDFYSPKEVDIDVEQGQQTTSQDGNTSTTGQEDNSSSSNCKKLFRFFTVVGQSQQRKSD